MSASNDTLGMAAICNTAGLNEIGAWFVTEFNRRERQKRRLRSYAVALEVMAAEIAEEK